MTYDPSIGKWLSEDPIGFAGGTTNLSEYVGNSPLNLVDPTGLAEESNLRSNLTHGRTQTSRIGQMPNPNSRTFPNGYPDIPNLTPQIDPNTLPGRKSVRSSNQFGTFTVDLEWQDGGSVLRAMIAFTPQINEPLLNKEACPKAYDIQLVQIARAWEKDSTGKLRVHRQPDGQSVLGAIFGDNPRDALTNNTVTSSGWHVDHLPSTFIDRGHSPSIYYIDSLIGQQSFVDPTPPVGLYGPENGWGRASGGASLITRSDPAYISDRPYPFAKVEFEVAARDRKTGQYFGSIEWGFTTDLLHVGQFRFTPYVNAAKDSPSQNVDEAVKKFNAYWKTDF